MKISVVTSANGTTNQIPVIFNRSGNISIHKIKKISDRKEDTKAEINPFENAVKSPEENILK